jgi:hypothetical protein
MGSYYNVPNKVVLCSEAISVECLRFLGSATIHCHLNGSVNSDTHTEHINSLYRTAFVSLDDRLA